jgi:hypothetical protein
VQALGGASSVVPAEGPIANVPAMHARTRGPAYPVPTLDLEAVRIGLDIELARLGSVRLELARYDNELARLDSL